ncbi:MAG: sigma factor [Kofleriaceae bacterium]
MITGQPAPPAVDDEVQRLAALQRWDDAAALVMRTYGDELHRYLVAIARDEADGDDAFGQFALDLWRGLPGFRSQASLRTWCYRVARHALARLRRDPTRRRQVASPSAPLAALIDEVRTRTATYLRTEVKAQVRDLRASLAPDDQAILVLRVDRDLAWRDIARAMADDDAELTEAEVVRRAASLRKRFERIKQDLRTRSQAAGLGPERR